MISSLIKFCEKSELIVLKRTKKGEKPVDLKPEFQLLDHWQEEGCAVFRARFTAGQKNINPTLLTDLFLKEEDFPKTVVQVLRKQIYLADGSVFE